MGSQDKGKKRAGSPDIEGTQELPSKKVRPTIDPDPDVSTEEQAPRGGNGRKKAAKQSAIAATKTFDTNPIKGTYAISEDEISTNPSYANIRRVKVWLENAVRLKKLEPTTATTAQRSSIAEWSTRWQPVQGRVHQIATVAIGAKPRLHISNKSSANALFVRQSKTINMPPVICGTGSDVEKRQRCRAVGNELCRLFDRCPIPMAGNGEVRLVQQLLRVAICNAFPDEKPYVIWPHALVKHGRDEHYYGVTIPHYNPDTGGVDSYYLGAYPTSFIGVDPDTIPDISDEVTFVEFQTLDIVQMEMVNGLPVLPRIVPNDEDLKGSADRRAHDAASKFMLYVAYQLTGLSATTKQMRAIRDSYARLLGQKTRNTYGIYDGFPLFLVTRELQSRRIIIDASKHFVDNIISPETIPTVAIRGSVAAADAATVLEAGLDEWVHTGDERLALLAAAKEADIVSQQKARGVRNGQCECSENMKLTQAHCCQRCTRYTLCCNRKYSILSGCWLCEPCLARDQLRIRKAGPDFLGNLLHIYLTAAMKREARKLDMDFNSDAFQSSIFSPALAAVLEKNTTIPGSNNLSYTDDYTGKAVIYGLQGIGLTTSTPSVDAALPKFRVVKDGEQKYYRHVAGNLFVTNAPTNRLKYTSLPGFLAHTSQYVKGEIDKRAFLDVCNQQLKVREKSPFPVSMLKHLPAVTDQQWKSELAAMVACESVEDSPGMPSQAWKSFRHNHNGQFSDADAEDLSRIYQEIIENSGGQACIGKDGCPWLLGPGDEIMPTGWSWTWCYNILTERLGRMNEICNKKWKTIESEKSLFCEIVYQRYTTDDASCHELLGFPLTIYHNHPLRFSIAHRHHGYQMRTGWPLDPKSLADRNAALNNMLVEAWATNIMKFNLDESYYPSFKTLIQNFNMPKSLFDPARAAEIDRTAPLPTHTSADFDEEDDFSVGDAGDDDIEDDVVQAYAEANENREVMEDDDENDED